MIEYIKVRSWHVQTFGGQAKTLCGLTVRAHPLPGEYQAQGWAKELPAGKSCESCLRALARLQPDDSIGGGQE